MEKVNREQLEELLKNNNSVIVDFYAEWCGPCKMMAPILNEIAGETGQIIVKVNIDEEPELTKEYGVMSVPTMIAMNHGSEVKRFTGFTPKPFLLNCIKELA